MLDVLCPAKLLAEIIVSCTAVLRAWLFVFPILFSSAL